MNLIDRLTNGSTIHVNETGATVIMVSMATVLYVGTAVCYSPGLLIGGRFEFECSSQRGIGYYLEPLIMLAPFTKLPVNITLCGPTNNSLDPSVSCHGDQHYKCACMCVCV